MLNNAATYLGSDVIYMLATTDGVQPVDVGDMTETISRKGDSYFPTGGRGGVKRDTLIHLRATAIWGKVHIDIFVKGFDRDLLAIERNRDSRRG
jgi:hypothetical protein